MFCPCGSSLLFKTCCQPFLNKKQLPTSAEQLMRSRFSAYATYNAQYIFDTYSKSQQTAQSVADIQISADECAWLALVIHDSVEAVVDNKSIVEFSAFYIADNKLCELRERSNFMIEQGEWRYIDGEIKVNDQLTQVKRNELCPCNNYPSAWSAKKAKKFKHCCAK